MHLINYISQQQQQKKSMIYFQLQTTITEIFILLILIRGQFQNLHKLIPKRKKTPEKSK